MEQFEYIIQLKSDTESEAIVNLPGAVVDGSTVRIPAHEREADLERRFLEFAAMVCVAKVAVALVLPSKLRLGSQLLESRWVYFTITLAEIKQHLRIDMWEGMKEFHLASFPDGKHAYAIRGVGPWKWSIDTAYWALYVAHAAYKTSVIKPEIEPSPEEQVLISAMDISIDYYDYDEASRRIRFIAELTYDEYFSLRDLQYLQRLARENVFRYDVPLYSEEGRVKYGLASDTQELVAQARRQFPDRPYEKVDFIIRDEEGARECHRLLEAMGFGVFFMDDERDIIWEWAEPVTGGISG